MSITAELTRARLFVEVVNVVLNFFSPMQVFLFKKDFFVDVIETKELKDTMELVVLNDFVVLLISEQHTVDCEETHVFIWFIGG
jgi:hypothetical protein